MSYNIQQHLTTVNRGAKGKNTPQWLVVHFIGATGQAWSNARYFKNTYRGASAHYFIDKGNIVQVVEDDTPAWHVGDGSRSGKGKYNGYHGYGATNNNSLGFELCLDTSTASSVWHMDFHIETLKRAEWLIKQKQKQYNIPNERVIRHFDASGKLCPGNWQWNNWAKWHAFKAKLANVKTTKPSGTVSKDEGKPTVNVKTYLVKTGDTLYKIARQHGVTVSQLKAWNNLDNTLIFPETYLFVSEPKEEVKPKPKPKKTTGWDLKSGNWTGGTLRQGDYGSKVRQLQELLASNYYYPDKGAKNNGVDGYYGTKTKDAVERYQSMHGLTVDGIAGRATYNKLKGNKATSKPKAVKVGDRVKIKTSASRYATGEKIPTSIKGRTYTVQQVKSDRVLLKEIYSWVKKTDVQ